MIEIKHKITGEVLAQVDVDNLLAANLSGANLRDADLRGSDLSGSNLRGSDLRRADLRWADLRWADLSEADMSGANLRDADLRGSDLRRADLRWADLIVISIGKYQAYIQSGKTRIGCECHSSDDWLSWSPGDVAHMDKGAREYWEEAGPLVKAAIMTLRNREKTSPRL